MSISDELGKLGELHQRGVLGDEEFARAKARVLSGSGSNAAASTASIDTLRRSRDDYWLGGVCAGLARFTSLPTWLWRLGFALMVLCAGTGVLIYLLLWIFLPQDEIRVGATVS